MFNPEVGGPRAWPRTRSHGPRPPDRRQIDAGRDTGQDEARHGTRWTRAIAPAGSRAHEPSEGAGSQTGAGAQSAGAQTPGAGWGGDFGGRRWVRRRNGGLLGGHTEYGMNHFEDLFAKERRTCGSKCCFLLDVRERQVFDGILGTTED